MKKIKLKNFIFLSQKIYKNKSGMEWSTTIQGKQIRITQKI